MFRAAIQSAAIETGRQVRILHQLAQGPDHPVDICHPEGEYLKGLILEVS
jgi:23S rRNA (cytosine1962-C5)-methyltransferase